METSPTVAVLRDIAQQSSHDLAGPSFGKLLHHQDAFGFGDGPDLDGDVVAEFGDQGVPGVDR